MIIAERIIALYLFANQRARKWTISAGFYTFGRAQIAFRGLGCKHIGSPVPKDLLIESSCGNSGIHCGDPSAKGILAVWNQEG
jgi:hypothetical protein